MSNQLLIIKNTGKDYALDRGYSILNNLLFNHIITPAKCGGKAICGRCRIKILSGNEFCNKPNSEEKVHLTDEQLQQGWRLACQTQCIRSIHIYLPDPEEIDNI